MKRKGVKRITTRASWASLLWVLAIGGPGCNGEKEEPFVGDPHLFPLRYNPPDPCSSPKLSPDQTRLYWMEKGRIIFVKDMDTREETPIYVGGDYGFTISPDNSLLVAANRDSELILLDSSGQVLDTIARRAILPRFTSDGRLYYCAWREPNPGVYRKESVYDTTEECVFSFGFFYYPSDPFDVSWDGSKLLTRSFFNTLPVLLVDLWDQSVDTLDFIPGGPYSAMVEVSLSPDGEFLAFPEYVEIDNGTRQIIMIVDLSAGDTVILDTRTYRTSYSYWPSWSSGGDTLVFFNWSGGGEDEGYPVVGVWGWKGVRSEMVGRLLSHYR